MAQPPKPLFDTLENHLRADASTLAAVVCPFPEDFKKAHEFLSCYRGSSATFSAYRREIERFLHWCGSVARKPVAQLKRQDIEAFVYFCQRPPEDWIAIKVCDRFKTINGERVANEHWRPFVATVNKVSHKAGVAPNVKEYALSQKALQAIFAVIGSFYNYLISEDYVVNNPVAQIRQKSKFIRVRQGQAPVRRLSDLQWSYVIETAEIMASSDPDLYQRSLFIMNALYGMFLRVSELAASERWTPEMADFHRDMDGNWWFTTVGKGNKQRDVTVSDAMLDALKRYRMHLGLTALPAPGEQRHLIDKVRGKGPVASTRHIRLIVQNCFDAAVARMIKDGFEEDADQLKAATVHWLRHTGISDDVKHRPREHVRDDAGHGSSAITDKYIDIELRERHASGKGKLIKQ